MVEETIRQKENSPPLYCDATCEKFDGILVNQMMRNFASYGHLIAFSVPSNFSCSRQRVTVDPRFNSRLGGKCIFGNLFAILRSFRRIRGHPSQLRRMAVQLLIGCQWPHRKISVTSDLQKHHPMNWRTQSSHSMTRRVPSLRY